MREVTFFWKKERLLNIDVGPVYEIVKQIVFLSYVKRVPKDIRCLFKIDFLEGKTPEMLNELYYLEVLEILHEPVDDSSSYVILMRLDHSLSNLNARTGGSTTVAGSKLDGEGMTYTIQGQSMKLRLLSGVARLMLKPDRTSARALNINIGDQGSPLKPKQMQLAKYAYDQGYYDIPKRVRITDLSEGMGLARATVSEHLSRIEAIIMDDMFSSFNRQYLTPKEMKEIVESIEIEAIDNNNIESESFQRLLSTIKQNIEIEESSIKLKSESFGTVSETEIEESMNIYNEKNNKT
jgi:hypothetical protein